MSLAQVRTDLADALGGLGVNVYDHLPGKAAVPSAILLGGSPYIEQADTFGAHLARLEVWLSTARGDNETETRHVDELTENAIKALLADGWVVELVSQPFQFEINNGQFLTVAITVTTTVTFT